jgi:hypothetical protein
VIGEEWVSNFPIEARCVVPAWMGSLKRENDLEDQWIRYNARLVLDDPKEEI